MTIFHTIHRILPKIIDKAKEQALNSDKKAKSRRLRRHFQYIRQSYPTELERQAAYDAVVEFNKKHNISPRDRHKKLFLVPPPRGKRKKITMPKLKFMED